MNREERDFRLARVREKKAALQRQIEELKRDEQTRQTKREAEEATRRAKRETESKSWWGKTKRALDPFHGLDDDIDSGLGLLFDVARLSTTLPLASVMNRELEELEEQEARLLGAKLD